MAGEVESGGVEDVVEAKKALRSEMRRRLAAIPQDVRGGPAQLLLATAWWGDAQTVLLFDSRRDEPETGLLARSAWASGKAVYLPQIQSDHQMQFIQVTSEDEMIPGAFGLREPSGKVRWEGESALCLVPGLAFDRWGRRLGRGKGFFDRFLEPHAEKLLLVGFCFQHQIVDCVPSADHDQRMNYLVTEQGVIEVSL